MTFIEVEWTITPTNSDKTDDDQSRLRKSVRNVNSSRVADMDNLDLTQEQTKELFHERGQLVEEV